VTVRFALADESDRVAFDRLASEHNDGVDSPLSVEPFERAAEQASLATARSMEIQDVERTARRTNSTGELVLAFTWTNFAGVSEDRLFVEDAFRTPGGTWLPGLAADQELVISFPEGYSPQSISIPGASDQLVNGTVYIQGPATFESPPAVVLVQTGGPPPLPWNLAAGAVVVVAILGSLGFLFRDRLRSVAWRGGADGEVIEGNPAVDDDPDPMTEPLLSDEERVLKLLEAKNGRMKQVEIVEATDWSNAKVSQLLSEMDEAGRVDKLRIGRENLISLPGQGPGSE
jgi:uncharacterized membrane protein